MSKKDDALKRFLGEIGYEKFYEAFSKEGITFKHLKHLEIDDIEGIFPKKFQRKLFFESVENLSKSKMEEGGKKKKVEEYVETTSKGQFVQILVKWGNCVANVYDIPLGISNKDLISELLHAFLKCEVKLPGEERKLVKALKSFNLQKWVERNGMSPEDEEIRLVLKVEGDAIAQGDSEKEKQLVKDLEDLKEKEQEWIRREKKLEEDLAGMGDAKKKEKKLRLKAERELKEARVVRKKLEEDLAGTGDVKKKEKELRLKAERELKEARAVIKKLEMKNKEREREKMEKKKASTSAVRVINQFVIPKHSFIPNQSGAKFSHGNKKASQTKKNFGSRSFKTNAVFKAGKKYYVQVRVHSDVRNGGFAIGVHHGNDFEINNHVGTQGNGWAYNYYPGYNQAFHGGGKDYGIQLGVGTHIVGILVDFTGGNIGKLSFVMDEVNQGVAYDNVKAPVSPAFTVYYKGDWIEIMDDFDLPRGL